MRLEGRVAIVTGGGRGIGRAYALLMASYGARVVVNDLGVTTAGLVTDETPAEAVAEEIRAAGGSAIANASDISRWDGASSVIEDALTAFGDLHIVVNNAGILRDRMLVNMTEEELDSVIAVNLRGTVATAHFAARYWRERAKIGAVPDARIINTTSASGLYGNTGQTNYAAAKAGVAGFTIVAAQELARYRVTVNAVAPGALTRLNQVAADMGRSTMSGGNPDTWGPARIAPLVAWLASRESSEITGRVFNVRSNEISVAEGWRRGPCATSDEMWTLEQLDDVVPSLVGAAAPLSDLFGLPIDRATA